MTKLTISAVVTYRVEKRNFAKPKTLTEVSIKAGAEVVAKRTMPGKWSQTQAMTEFRRFPTRFTATGSTPLAALATAA